MASFKKSEYDIFVVFIENNVDGIYEDLYDAEAYVSSLRAKYPNLKCFIRPERLK